MNELERRRREKQIKEEERIIQEELQHPFRKKTKSMVNQVIEECIKEIYNEISVEVLKEVKGILVKEIGEEIKSIIKEELNSQVMRRVDRIKNPPKWVNGVWKD